MYDIRYLKYATQLNSLPLAFKFVKIIIISNLNIFIMPYCFNDCFTYAIRCISTEVPKNLNISTYGD